MDTITVEGMVLSAMPIGEYDRRIVLLTTRLGRISAFVRGARKPSSTLLAASRPFSMGEFVLHPGRDSYTVQSASIREHFEKLSQDVVGMAYGCYFMELAAYYSEENVNAKDLLNLLYVSLKALENPSIPDSLVRLIYELRVFACEGEYPQVFECRSCKKKLTRGWISVRKGNCVCEQCKLTVKSGYTTRLEESQLYTLQYILTAPLGKLYTFRISPEVKHVLEHFMERWRFRYLNREFHSLSVLKDMLALMPPEEANDENVNKC